MNRTRILCDDNALYDTRMCPVCEPLSNLPAAAVNENGGLTRKISMYLTSPITIRITCNSIRRNETIGSKNRIP